MKIFKRLLILANLLAGFTGRLIPTSTSVIFPEISYGQYTAASPTFPIVGGNCLTHHIRYFYFIHKNRVKSRDDDSGSSSYRDISISDRPDI